MKSNPPAAPAEPVLLALLGCWLAAEALAILLIASLALCSPSPGGGQHRPPMIALAPSSRRLALRPMSARWALHLVPSGARFYAGAPGVDSHLSEAARFKGIAEGG